MRSTDIPFLKEPRPFAEIFVYNTQMESVHLRGGPVARGGIRWSERPEDYRQEVLGLMKAQLIKNALIVPTGSKGGFIIKRAPVDSHPQSLKLEVELAYQTMMHGMLDITDTIALDKSIIPPVNVVRRDGDDPYLVVAADKGTATFSDLANGCAQSRHFWLDDAFASGGSVGYDHKAMGITAKGGWEAVKRHFRERGRDIQTQDFTVIGVGDMSGDVFGNGMLLSPHIRLLGAFNHKHIFVDPNPNTAVSFEERKRLFETPRTQWTDYKPEALSPGGRIYPRDVREITLTPEIKSCFGIHDDVVHPDFLIQTLLKHDVDLLWFGGIGTFIRARHETDRDVMDKANDSLRIVADDVRAAVIGEGANLGMTQAARVAAALAGVKLNTDAIDNSGGVDCSDHEVNIKILLASPVRRGDMTLAQRNDLLASMTDDVAYLVLRNNYLQTQALSSLEYQGTALVHPLKRLMHHLEASGQLNRALEGLPTDATIDARLEQGLGFVRPELAVLLAHSKIALKKDLQGTSLLEEERMLEDVALYFPKRLRESFSEDMKTHPLKKDIIATFTANSMINRMGPHFAFSMQQAAGCELCDVVRAYTIVREVFQLRGLWKDIESLDNKVSATTQHKMLFYTTRLANSAIAWLLRKHAPGTLAVTELVKTFRPLVQECMDIWDDILVGEERAVVEKTQNALIYENVPESLAKRIALLRPMMGVLDVIALADQAQADLSKAGRAYMAVYDALSLHQVHRFLSRLSSPTLWDQQARDALRADLYAAHRDLAARLLNLSGTLEEAQDAWLNQTAPQRKQFLDMMSQMDENALRLSNLVVLMRFLKAMVG
jgi:glutamate dehydrogenase